jgi:peroxiredoxin
MKKLSALALGFMLAACGGNDAPVDRSATAPNAQAGATTPVVAAPTGAAATPPAVATPPAPGATVGELAPDFTLVDQAGASHSLASYRGRIVVLEWTNPTCPYVVRHSEAGTMRRLDAGFADQDVVWIAIDSSRTVVPADSEAFRVANALPYPVLQDPHGVVGRAYGARTTPHMFVIDREGKVRYSGAIDDDPRGQVAAPTNHVERAVEALLAGQAPPVSTTEPYGCSVKYEGS